jgi:hypothetical protein
VEFPAERAKDSESNGYEGSPAGVDDRQILGILRGEMSAAKTLSKTSRLPIQSCSCVEADAIRQFPGRKLRNDILAMQVKGLGAPFQPNGAVGIDQNPIRAQVISKIPSSSSCSGAQTLKKLH